MGTRWFLSEPGLKPDHDLRLTGEISRLLRGERGIQLDFPASF